MPKVTSYFKKFKDKKFYQISTMNDIKFEKNHFWNICIRGPPDKEGCSFNRAALQSTWWLITRLADYYIGSIEHSKEGDPSTRHLHLIIKLNEKTNFRNAGNLRNFLHNNGVFKHLPKGPQMSIVIKIRNAKGQHDLWSGCMGYSVKHVKEDDKFLTNLNHNVCKELRDYYHESVLIKRTEKDVVQRGFNVTKDNFLKKLKEQAQYGNVTISKVMYDMHMEGYVFSNMNYEDQLSLAMVENYHPEGVRYWYNKWAHTYGNEPLDETLKPDKPVYEGPKRQPSPNLTTNRRNIHADLKTVFFG